MVGAPTLDVALTSRMPGVISGVDLGLPTLGGDVALGWRQYLEPWGQAALGLNLGLGWQSASDARRPFVYHPRLGVTARIRGLNEGFFSAEIGLYGEVGPLLLDGGQAPADLPELAGVDRGLSWSMGVETGPGALVHLAPAVFAEVSARLGVEFVRLGGLETQSVTAGLRVGLEWGVLDPSPD